MVALWENLGPLFHPPIDNQGHPDFPRFYVGLCPRPRHEPILPLRLLLFHVWDLARTVPPLAAGIDFAYAGHQGKKHLHLVEAPQLLTLRVTSTTDQTAVRIRPTFQVKQPKFLLWLEGRFML